MLTTLRAGRYVARPATSASDVQAAQRLRALCFERPGGRDRDKFDDHAAQIIVEDSADGTVVCCFRLMGVQGDTLSQSYAAQYYDLEGLTAFEGRMLELGRFCVAPERNDPDILRIAWALMTACVDRADVRLLFGCSSFAGVDPAPYRAALATLRARHLAPQRWMPQVKAPDVVHFAQDPGMNGGAPAGGARMPSLLRTYLMMGGWVSDHAVVDSQMNTLHVFTGLEIGAIPENRKQLLRAMV